MTKDSHEAPAHELAQLPIMSFVDVLQRAFDARVDDLRLRHFDRRYALAICSIYQPEGGPPDPRHVAVELVARPLGEHVEDDLSESGTCPQCRLEAISTSKNAQCALCGAEVGPT